MQYTQPTDDSVCTQHEKHQIGLNAEAGRNDVRKKTSETPVLPKYVVTDHYVKVVAQPNSAALYLPWLIPI